MTQTLAGHSIAFFYEGGGDASTGTPRHGPARDAILQELVEIAGGPLLGPGHLGVRHVAGIKPPRPLDLTAEWQAIVASGVFANGLYRTEILIEGPAGRANHVLRDPDLDCYTAMEQAVAVEAALGRDLLCATRAELTIRFWNGAKRTNDATALLKQSQTWLRQDRALGQTADRFSVDTEILRAIFNVNAFLERPIDAQCGFFSTADEQPEAQSLIRDGDAVWKTARNLVSTDPLCLDKRKRPREAFPILTQKGVRRYAEALWTVHSQLPDTAGKLPPLPDFVAQMTADAAP